MSFSLNFSFSQKQKKLSELILANFINNLNTLVFAVTGSGKTEICFPLIDFLITNKYKFAFVSPRKIICDSIYYRMKKSFPAAQINLSYGGLKKIHKPNILVSTCHQLQNYYNYFDLVIIDEIDAYPLKGNDYLLTKTLQSSRKNFILLTATPTEEDLKLLENCNGVVLYLYERYHKEKLPVPRIKSLWFLSLLYMLKKEIQIGRKCIVFVPKISDVGWMKSKLSSFYNEVVTISSISDDRKSVVHKFLNLPEVKIIVSTTILERGITFPKIAVFVWNTNHHVFSKETLIQIAGRAGRSLVDKKGSVYFFGPKTKKIMSVVSVIESLNNELSYL